MMNFFAPRNANSFIIKEIEKLFEKINTNIPNENFGDSDDLDWLI